MMKRFLPVSGKTSGTLFFTFFLFLNVYLSFAQTVTTDKDDYPPGGTVIISGSGWNEGEIVTLKVLHEGEPGDNTTSPSGAHAPWEIIADADGNISSTWTVPFDEDELGATLLLTADGADSKLHAEWTFTDSGAFSYGITSGKSNTVSLAPGSIDNTTISVDVDAPKKNGNFGVSLDIVNFGSPSITIGSGTTQINLSSSTNSYTTTNSSGDIHVFPITVEVGSSVADGSYNFQVTAVESGGSFISDGPKWNFTVVVGSTGGSIESVSIASQSGTSTYGTASSPTYAVTSTRGSNGTVNGTYSVDGLPPGVTSGGFSPSETFTSNGGDPFPGATLTLNVDASLDAGSYDFDIFLTDGASQATTTGTLVVNKRDLVVSATGVDKVYDGTTTATVTLSTDALSGDAVTAAYTTASFADENVGTGKTVSVSGISISGVDAGNYNLTNNTASTMADITAKDLVVSATGIDKVYDGTTTASVNLSTDALSGDAVTAAYTTASFADENVGTGRTVSVSGISISGVDAGNYNLTNNTASTTADITAKDLVVSATGIDKVYDGTTTASVNLSTDALSGDAVTAAYTTASFADENVGTGKTVSVSGISISGVDAGNYNLTNNTASTTADITAKDLVVSATGVDKVYDGTTTATVNLITDALSGDAVTAAYTTASFADENVGTGKTVSVSGISISGVDAGNYNLTNNTASTTADITAKDLVVSATGVDKVYDGTTTATVTLSTDALSGDAVTAAYTTASFADENVGTGKTVSVSGISISGVDAENYNLTNNTASTMADITAKDLVVSATGIDKVYDGTTTASVNLSTDALSGDAVTAAYTTASFADENVGTGKTVSVSGISISGVDAGNYNLTNNTASTTADITAKDLVVSATGVDKVYDGTTTATVNLITDALSGDAVTAAYTTASFADENVGTGKTVSVSGISISGVDAGNYNLTNNTASTTADITAKDLVVSATGVDKVYDGTTTATVTLSTDALSGDAVTAAYTTASFADENVGTGKTVSVSGISISGADAGNYNLTNTTATTSADITARPITITADAGQTKVYGDADPAAYTYTVTSGSLASTDNFDGALTRVAGETVDDYAINKGTLTIVEGATNKESNYTVTYVSNDFSITARPITITADAGQTKVYGEANPGSYTYTVSGDGLASTDSFDGALTRDSGETVDDYAINKGTLTIVEGATNKESNYTVTYVSNDFSITARPITITADAGQTKVYGEANPGSYTYTVSGDGLASTDSFDGALTRDSGETVDDYAINKGTLTIVEGATNKESNYTVTYVSNDFSITARPITITADAGQTKVYGEANPGSYTYTVSGDGLASTDSFDGALTRVAGETVDDYAINKGTLTIVEGATNKESNYTVTYVSNDFSITARPITITADAGQTKVYGEANPGSYTYTVSGDGLATGDSFDGALTRVAGETVDDYAINKGTLTIVEGATNKESNYTVTYVSNDFSITARPITITADAGQTKVYGEANPGSYTYTVSGDGLASTDLLMER